MLADRTPRATLQRRRASACVASARRRDSPRCTAPCRTSRKSRSKASTANIPRPTEPAGERTRCNHRDRERARMTGSVETLATVGSVRSGVGGLWNMERCAMDLKGGSFTNTGRFAEPAWRADARAPADPAIGPKASPAVCVPAHIDQRPACRGGRPMNLPDAIGSNAGISPAVPVGSYTRQPRLRDFLRRFSAASVCFKTCMKWRVRDVRVMSSQSG